MRTRIASILASLSVAGSTLAADPVFSRPSQLPAITEAAPAEPPAVPGGPSLAVEPIPPGYSYPAMEPVANRAPRFWVTPEVLGWWVQGQTLPILATTSIPGTPVSSAGVLNSPTTLPVIGGQRVNGDMRIGGRITGGLWLDDCQRCGIAHEFFILNQDGERYTIASSGAPILARPFASVPSGLRDAQIIAFPGVASGSIQVDASNQFLGASLFGLHQICCGCNYQVYAMAGYRYLRLADRVSILESTTAAPGNMAGLPAGTAFALRDSFRTTNNFHGGDIGLRARVYRGRVFGDIMGRLAIGGTHRELDSSGETRIALPGQPPVQFPGGFLTQGPPRHISDTVFSFVPELRLNLGYQITPNVDVFAGYSVLWWTNVIRAGEQINLRVSPAALPPPLTSVTPASGLNDTTIWVQGISLGMTFRY